MLRCTYQDLLSHGHRFSQLFNTFSPLAGAVASGSVSPRDGMHSPRSPAAVADGQPQASPRGVASGSTAARDLNESKQPPTEALRKPTPPTTPPIGPSPRQSRKLSAPQVAQHLLGVGQLQGHQQTHADSPIMSLISLSAPASAAASAAASPNATPRTHVDEVDGVAGVMPASVMSVITGLDGAGSKEKEVWEQETSSEPRRSLADASAAATEKARARAKAHIVSGRTSVASGGESPAKRAGMTAGAVRKTHHRYVLAQSQQRFEANFSALRILFITAVTRATSSAKTRWLCPAMPLCSV